jgi:hypothetical protein
MFLFHLLGTRRCQRHVPRARGLPRRLVLEVLEERHLLSFLPAVSYDTGRGPISVAVGDFNGDGRLDLVTANLMGHSVSVLLGNGDGTFQTAQTYPVGPSPSAVAVGDFDGDGHLDLAVIDSSLDRVSVLLGNGDGSFRDAGDYAVGRLPFAVVVGDFNGDGRPDLAVVNYEGGPDGRGSLSVLLGNGDGTFQTAQSYAAGPNPTSLAVADLNGDGKPDLVVANWDGVRVLLGNGDGSFRAPVYYVVGFFPWSVAVGDFKGDGKLDLVTANQAPDDSVSVLLGNGDRTFQKATYYHGGPQLYGVVVADFNHDGHLDLAVANALGSAVGVLLGKGDGTFQDVQNYATGRDPLALATGDFNSDGLPDLVTANFAAGTVGVLLNDGVWAPRASAGGAAFTSHSSVLRNVPAGGTSLQREITWAPVNPHAAGVAAVLSAIPRFLDQAVVSYSGLRPGEPFIPSVARNMPSIQAPSGPLAAAVDSLFASFPSAHHAPIATQFSYAQLDPALWIDACEKADHGGSGSHVCGWR